MNILNFGSVNIDHVYAVDHFVRPGETISSHSYQRFSGGKGFNQSIALAHGGAKVCHAGKIGKDGLWLREQLRLSGVDTSFLDVVDCPTGHAIIQINPAGENAIVIHGGANQHIAKSDVTKAISRFSAGDYLLVQNEISSVPDVIREAYGRDLTIVFNPAPMTAALTTYPLELVDIFILNEIEAKSLTNEVEHEKICTAMCKRYGDAATVLTLGKKGAMYFDSETMLFQPAETVNAVDTTAAGDTFIGFFLAELICSQDVEKALRLGCRAAAVCVTRPGAAVSIPQRSEIEV